MRRDLNEHVSVSGQIDPDDVRVFAEAGFQVLVNARPDGEIPDTHHSAVMEDAAKAAGLAFHYIPMTPGTLPTEEEAAAFLGATQGGRVLAYCGGGPRAIVLASFAAAADGQPVDAILTTARQAGMDLERARELLIERGAASS